MKPCTNLVLLENVRVNHLDHFLVSVYSQSLLSKTHCIPDVCHLLLAV